MYEETGKLLVISLFKFAFFNSCMVNVNYELVQITHHKKAEGGGDDLRHSMGEDINFSLLVFE
jgi:hypothetical protein